MRPPILSTFPSYPEWFSLGGCLVNEPSSFQSCCRIKAVKYLSVTLPLSELGNRLLVKKRNVPEVPDGGSWFLLWVHILQLYLPRQQDDWSERGSKPQKRSSHGSQTRHVTRSLDDSGKELARPSPPLRGSPSSADTGSIVSLRVGFSFYEMPGPGGPEARELSKTGPTSCPLQGAHLGTSESRGRGWGPRRCGLRAAFRAGRGQALLVPGARGTPRGNITVNVSEEGERLRPTPAFSTRSRSKIGWGPSGLNTVCFRREGSDSS